MLTIAANYAIYITNFISTQLEYLELCIKILYLFDWIDVRFQNVRNLLVRLSTIKSFDFHFDLEYEQEDRVEDYDSSMTLFFLLLTPLTTGKKKHCRFTFPDASGFASEGFKICNECNELNITYSLEDEEYGYGIDYFEVDTSDVQVLGIELGIIDDFSVYKKKV